MKKTILTLNSKAKRNGGRQMIKIISKCCFKKTSIMKN